MIKGFFIGKKSVILFDNDARYHSSREDEIDFDDDDDEIDFDDDWNYNEDEGFDPYEGYYTWDC